MCVFRTVCNVVVVVAVEVDVIGADAACKGRKPNEFIWLVASRVGINNGTPKPNGELSRTNEILKKPITYNFCE